MVLTNDQLMRVHEQFIEKEMSFREAQSRFAYLAEDLEPELVRSRDDLELKRLEMQSLVGNTAERTKKYQLELKITRAERIIPLQKKILNAFESFFGHLDEVFKLQDFSLDSQKVFFENLEEASDALGEIEQAFYIKGCNLLRNMHRDFVDLFEQLSKDFSAIEAQAYPESLDRIVRPDAQLRKHLAQRNLMFASSGGHGPRKLHLEGVATLLRAYLHNFQIRPNFSLDPNNPQAQRILDAFYKAQLKIFSDIVQNQDDLEPFYKRYQLDLDPAERQDLLAGDPLSFHRHIDETLVDLSSLPMREAKKPIKDLLILDSLRTFALLKEYGYELSPYNYGRTLTLRTEGRAFIKYHTDFCKALTKMIDVFGYSSKAKHRREFETIAKSRYYAFHEDTLYDTDRQFANQIMTVGPHEKWTPSLEAGPLANLKRVFAEEIFDPILEQSKRERGLSSIELLKQDFENLDLESLRENMKYITRRALARGADEVNLLQFVYSTGKLFHEYARLNKHDTMFRRAMKKLPWFTAKT